MTLDWFAVGVCALIALVLFAADASPPARRSRSRHAHRHRPRTQRRQPLRQVEGAKHPEQYVGLKHQRVRSSGVSISNRDDRNLPATVYLIAGHSHVKVGITSQRLGTQRIDEHLRHGWCLIESWDVPTLLEAHRIEQAMLRTWRSWPDTRTTLTSDDMPQGGVSETALLSDEEVNSSRSFIADQVRLLSTPIISTELSPRSVGQIVEITGTVHRLTPVRAASSTSSRSYVHWWKIEVTTLRGAVTLEIPEAKFPTPRPALKSEIRAKGVLELDNGRFLIGQPTIAGSSTPPRTTRSTPTVPNRALGTDSATGTIIDVVPGQSIVIETKTGTITCTGTTRPTLLGLGVQVRVQGRFSGPRHQLTVNDPSWQVVGHSRTA